MIRLEALRARIIGDVPAPARRQGASVRKLDAWYAAFHVGRRDALLLAPADRMRMW